MLFNRSQRPTRSLPQPRLCISHIFFSPIRDIPAYSPVYPSPPFPEPNLAACSARAESRKPGVPSHLSLSPSTDLPFFHRPPAHRLLRHTHHLSSPRHPHPPSPACCFFISSSTSPSTPVDRCRWRLAEDIIGAMLRSDNQRFIKHYKQLAVNVALSYLKGSMGLFSTSSGGFTEQVEQPERRQRSERKPLVTSISELKCSARLERKMRQGVCEIMIKPPENGLLVKRLIPVALEVYDARKELYDCASLVLKSVHVHVCRLCEEVYVGKFPHQIRTCDVAGSLPTKEHCWVPGETEHVLPRIDSFHLYDRLGRAVSHEERLQVDRIPAIVELCMQAGMDIPEYPTKRRVYPVYNIAGKLIDFERKFPRDYSSGKDIEPHGFWLRKKVNKHCSTPSFSANEDLQGIALRGMNAWEKMRSGAIKLMQKYAVQTCGYCPEVQVGPKGHRARICQAYKHQMRAGQHAWQKATIDDLVPPVYVWHVPGPHSGGELLVHDLRGYYGKLPAVLELFAQAGACVGEGYGGLMREDVAVPGLDAEKLVV